MWGLGNWRECGEWHELLDAVCNGGGYHDNAELAAAFCARTGKNSQADFEAAKKKLRNWRNGKRIPRRGSMAVLAETLGIGHDPALEKRWHALYRAASGRGADTAHAASAAEAAGERSSRMRLWSGLGVVPVVLGAGIAAVVVADGRQSPSVELPAVNYKAYVRLSLGTSRLIHGEYGDCDGPPPDWAQVVQRVPQTTLGTFADGGLARKMVNDCGREIVVRAVMFTGMSVGTEELQLLGDYMKIDVVDQQATRPSGGWE